MQYMSLTYQMWGKTQSSLLMHMSHSFFFFFKERLLLKQCETIFIHMFLKISHSFRTPVNVHLRKCKTS